MVAFTNPAQGLMLQYLGHIQPCLALMRASAISDIMINHGQAKGNFPVSGTTPRALLKIYDIQMLQLHGAMA